MGFEYERAFGTVVGVAVMNTITQFTTETSAVDGRERADLIE